MTDPTAHDQPGAADPVLSLFASASVTEHLVRGVLGLVLVVGGLALAGQSAWALLALPVGVLAWRGCPTCWTLGLVETLGRGRVARDCAGGTCVPVTSP